MEVKYASDYDLMVLNLYFVDTGRRFTINDNIAIFDTYEAVGHYLFNDCPRDLLGLLNERKPTDETTSLLENLIDELGNVWQDSETGLYYVMKNL